MSDEAVRARFRELGVWQRGGERAPYKPLLLLYALAGYRSGGERLIPFAEIKERLPGIFRAFGPARKSYRVAYPFWYLRTDGIWQVQAATNLEARTGKAREPSEQSLLVADARGGLTPELFAAVTADDQLLRDIVSDLLHAHFPDTLHDEILSAVGLELAVKRAVRNALFRQDVLLAYEARCAVCDFDARLIESLLAIEAAHVRWHQAGGPATIENGVALCSLHHNLFDRGAFTLTPDLRLEVSQQVSGGPATEAQLIRFHGTRMRLPSNPAHAPQRMFVTWHREQVFKAPGRWLGPA